MVSRLNKRIIIYNIFILLFFLAGFTRTPFFKIFGIQIYVVIAMFIMMHQIVKAKRGYVISTETTKAYNKFLIFSIPALCIGVIFGQYSCLYFYLYTLLAIFLYKESIKFALPLDKLLIATEISLFIITLIGWGMHLQLLPYNFLYNVDDLLQNNEFNLGYWSLSYLPSSRNHDYMYPMVLGCISAYRFLKKESNLYLFQLIIFILSEITLIVSLSRGAMIIAILLFIILYKKTHSTKKFIMTCIILIMGTIIPMFVIMNFNLYKDIFNSIFTFQSQMSINGGIYSNEDRLKIYKNALFHILINPIGYGIENYSIISSSVKGYEKGASAENAYLTIFVERGWIAGIYFISFLYKALKNALRSFKEKASLNMFLVPAVSIYFFFNYEFMAFTCCFVFYLIMFSDNQTIEQNE